MQYRCCPPLPRNRLSICLSVSVCLPLGVWDKVLCPVAEKRAESGTLKLFPVYLKGEDLFGLTVPAVVKITESVCSAFFPCWIQTSSNHLVHVVTRLLYGTHFPLCSSLEWRRVNTTHSVSEPTLWWSCPSWSTQLAAPVPSPKPAHPTLRSSSGSA